MKISLRKFGRFHALTCMDALQGLANVLVVLSNERNETAWMKLDIAFNLNKKLITGHLQPPRKLNLSLSQAVVLKEALINYTTQDDYRKTLTMQLIGQLDQQMKSINAVYNQPLV